MRNRILSSNARWIAAAILIIMMTMSAMAQQGPGRGPISGLISDYTAVSGISGPWEMRGEWSLSFDRESGTASFSATVNMTHSDYWVLLNPGSADDNSATGRHPHTHHITVMNATVTALDTGGFEVSGPVYVTNDGNPAPFMSKCATLTPCTLSVDITGGSILQLSNLTMTFAGAPTTHFGTQPIHGVVRKLK